MVNNLKSLIRKSKVKNFTITLAIIAILQPNISNAMETYSPGLEVVSISVDQSENLIDDLTIKHRGKLLDEYLEKVGSPIKGCGETIAKTNNWQKIMSLGTAESNLGKRSMNFNAWGVMSFANGKASIRKMGTNWCESVVAMDEFLNNYPRKGKTYAQRTIEEMCNLYKQPCHLKPTPHHWVTNNNVILKKMRELETEAVELATHEVNNKNIYSFNK